MTNRQIKLAVFAAVIIALGLTSIPKADEAQVPRIDQLEGEHLSGMMVFTMQQHLKHHQPSPGININTLSNFVNTLDPARIFLLSNEVAQIHAQRLRMLTAFRDNRWDFVTNFYQSVFMPNVRASYDYAVRILSDTNYVPDTSLKIPVDVKPIDFPVTPEERDKYLESTLAYQVAFMESMGEARSNACQKVIKRRERILKYFSEMDYHEQFGLFMNAFCTALDPHTSYFPPDDMEDFNISMSLSLEGIGATLKSDDGYVVISELTPGSPADKCGKLKPGDKIIAVAQGENGEFVDVVDMELRDVVKQIRGKKGTTVVLRILRKTKKGIKNFDLPLVRDKVKLEDQGPRMEIVDISRTNGLSQAKSVKVAVIDLPSFYLDSESKTLFGDFDHSAVADVRRLLISCNTQKVDGVILDLQRNGGGILDEAVNMAGLFLKRGNVVLTKYSRGDVQILNDKNQSITYFGPLMITTSSLTASAAEIVTGALRSYNRCLVVGQSQSYGKGSVQQIIPLTGRLGALKITRGLYYIANGISPQFDGIKSDIVLPSNLDAVELGERYLPCALSAPKIDSHLSLESTTGLGVWTPITTNLINRLRFASASRVAKSEAFSDIKKFIEKSEDERKRVYISIKELLEDNDKSNELGEDDDETEDEVSEEVAEEDDDDEPEAVPEEDSSQAMTKTQKEIAKLSRRQHSVTNNILIQESLQIMGDWLMPDTVK
ncbi:carboxy terminal-processing peptidase [bacterium]|nr:carboxy terminal-processing peptidase [bacterium]